MRRPSGSSREDNGVAGEGSFVVGLVDVEKTIGCWFWLRRAEQDGPATGRCWKHTTQTMGEQDYPIAVPTRKRQGDCSESRGIVKEREAG